MGIPETEKTHNDLIDILIDACQTVEEIEDVDGRLQKQLVLDPEKVWWKTHLVNAPTFGRFAFELKILEGLALQCYNNMSKQRASVLANQIMNIVASYKYSIDAKSSESIRDKNNTQSTLIDKINRNKIEKAYTVKGEMKKSLWDGFLGREGQKEADSD